MDPLAQLQDIQLPDKIHNYPLAIGWWIMAIICIAAIIFIAFKVISHKKARRSQSQAIEQINANNLVTIADCVSVIKWAALQYFPRERIARLYGDNLYSFLLETLPNNHQEKFKTLCDDSLQTMYQKDLSNNTSSQFQQASLYWLKHALPPKSDNTASSTLKENK